jgi:hypothetical protein
MTTRTESGSPFSLRSALADHVITTPRTAAPTSSLESAMYAMSHQIARAHIQARHQEAEAWRIRRIARAARRAEAAERRARRAREAASYAAHRHSIAIAR